MATEVPVSKLIMGMPRLARDLHAFGNPSQRPTFLGGRFIAPGQGPSLNDYGNEALIQTLGRLLNGVGSYLMGSQVQESPEIRAKKALVEELKELTQRVEAAYTEFMPCLEKDFSGIGSQADNATLLFHFKFMMCSLPKIAEGVTKHLGGEDSLRFLDDFLSRHPALLADTQPSTGPHLKPLLSWWTLPYAPPLNLLIKIANDPSKSIDLADLTTLQEWATSCSSSQMPPTASDYYELIRNMCACKGALSTGFTFGSISIEERCLQTLERLWSEAGLDLYAPSLESVNKFEHLKSGDAICIQSPAYEKSEMPQELVHARVLEVEGSRGYPGVLKTLTAEIVAREGSSDKPPKKYEILVFNDPLLGLLHHRRMRDAMRECPLFQAPAELGVNRSTHPPKASYTFSSCEVHVREPLKPFNGDFKNFKESLIAAFRWMAENMVCFDLDPSKLGVCLQTEKLLFMPPVMFGEIESKGESTLGLDVAVIEDRVLSGQNLSALSDQLKEALEELYQAANVQSRSEKLKTTHSGRAELPSRELDPVTRKVLESIKKLDPKPRNPAALLCNAVDALMDYTPSNRLFKLLCKVQSEELRPQVNGVLIDLLTQKATQLNQVR